MHSITNGFIKNYKPIDIESLGKPIHVIREKLESLMSSSCDSLTHELQNWLKDRVVHAEIKQVAVHSISATDMDKTATSTFLHASGGKVYISSDSAILIKLVDSFYDAKVDRASDLLSHSDLRLQERIGRKVISWLAPQDMWSNGEFEPTQGMGLLVEIEITTEHAQGILQIKLDESLVATLTEELDLQRNQSLFEPLCHSLTSTPVQLDVLLSKKEMTLSDLISLQPNDVLPIELLSSSPVSIGDEHLFNGRVAEKNGQLVLIINPDKES